MNKMIYRHGFFYLILCVMFICVFTACTAPKKADGTISSKVEATTEQTVLSATTQKNESQNIYKVFSEKINTIPAVPLSESRLALLKELDDFIRSTDNGKFFSFKAYDLLKIRLDQVLEDISSSQVSKGQIKLWYLYNMGIIVKSENKIIAFDLPNSIVYPNIADFTKNLDVLVITHLHEDHFDPKVVKTALENGVSVILPDEKIVIAQTGSSKTLIKSPEGEGTLDFLNSRFGLKSENLIAAKALEQVTIKGINLTGYPAVHMHNPDFPDDPIALFPLDWFFVELNGINLITSGDSSTLVSQSDFSGKQIDVFMVHFDDPRASDNLAKLVPEVKTVLPLHVLELQHGSEILDYMMYKNILDENDNGYWKNNKSAKFIPLVWGEGILISK